MEKSQLGIAIGLSLAGFVVFLATVIILILLKKRKSSRKPPSTFDRSKDASKSNRHSKDGTLNSRSAIVDSSLASSDSSNYMQPAGLHHLKTDTSSKVWRSKNNLVQQPSNPQPPKLPRQPFESQPSNTSVQHLSQQSSLDPKLRQKPLKESQNVAKTPSKNSKVGLRPSKDGKTPSSKNSKHELIVEEEWESTVDDIFNSALSLHEHDSRATVYPKP